MKTIIFLLALSAGLAGVICAQVSGNAIGLRLGYDAQEVSFQHPFTNANRLEFTLGVNTFGRTLENKLCRGAGINGLYQWVNDLSSLSNGLNWYLGLGANVLDHGSLSRGLYGAGALVEIGVEYNFVSPWQISVDYRPGMYWLPGAGNIYRFSWNAPCISIRYHL